MKTVKTFATVFFLTLYSHASFAQESSLDTFLEKLNKYKETHKPNIEWRMPVAKPGNQSDPMPSPKVIGYMEDREMGLRYYAVADRVYDPATGYSYSTETGKIYDKVGAEVLFRKL